MRRLFVFSPVIYDIAGFNLVVQREKGSPAIFGPDIMDTFSVTQSIESPDFVLTIPSSNFCRSNKGEKKVSQEGTDLIFDYSSDREDLVLSSDVTWKNWRLYSTLSGNNVDDWFEKLGNLFAWSVLTRNVFVIHGVILEWNGKGIILTAASGTGKTTHARLWRQYENALIINGDRTLLRQEGDIWYACGIPWSGSSGECINRKVPLHAIVFLERGDVNTTDFMKPLEAFSRILPRIIAPQWNSELSTVAIDLAIQCLEKIPAIRLVCRPDEESVYALKEAIMTI